jgi:DHA1 family multidrug resistance protein-like MFS transporter
LGISFKAEEEIKDAKTIINTYLFRPIHMLIREPILLLVTLYLTLVYGLLYLFFEVYPSPSNKNGTGRPESAACPSSLFSSASSSGVS